MDWTIGFIVTLYTPLGTTGNFSDTVYLHTQQITTAPAKSFSVCSVLSSRSLATASNIGDPSTSSAQLFLSQLPVQNSCQFSQFQLTTINSGNGL
jgi:hypothetical protein